MLKLVKSEWCPEAFIVTFKLESDINIINEKVRQAMTNVSNCPLKCLTPQQYKLDIVLSNILSTRENKIYLHDRTMLDPSSVTFDSGLLIEKQSANDCLEAHLIPILCDKHREYSRVDLE